MKTKSINKMTKRELISLAWDLSKGGDISRLRKQDMIKFVLKHQRDRILNDLLNN